MMTSTLACVLALLLVTRPYGVEAQSAALVESKCQCEQSDLQCPQSLYGNFEKANNIREEGDKAHWVLECSGEWVFLFSFLLSNLPVATTLSGAFLSRCEDE